MTDRPVAAAGLILLAMALLAFLDSTVVIIARDIGLWQFHFIRACMAVSVVLLIAWFGWVTVSANRLWAVIVRGGCTATAMLIYFGCLAFIPISQVAAGLFSAPLWVLLINWIVFRRPAALLRIVLTISGFIGVLIVLNPFKGSFDPVSVAPLAAGVFYAVGNIATREWCRGESTFSMLTWFFISLGVFGLLGIFYLSLFPQQVPVGPEGFIVRGPVWPTTTAWLLTTAQAVGSIAGVGLVMKSYQLGEVNFVSVFEYSLIVFAAIWGWMFWEQIITPREIAGIVIILVSGGLLALSARKATEPA